MKLIVQVALFLIVASGYSQAKLKALIIDGQNNHAVWPKSTVMMKQYLEDTDLFTVDIYRTSYTWRAERETDYLKLGSTKKTKNLDQPLKDKNFTPEFQKYDVVISNLGFMASPWPEHTQRAFENYMKSGGGFVSVHAADNSFPEWEAYNQMIGLGGWGNRDESDGPYVYYTNQRELVRDTTSGKAGAHGKRHHFPITIRNHEHPITKGMPKVWLTGVDECYAKLRGPAKNLTVLATGKDQSKNAPTDRHEPVLMVIDYGKGRIFHTTFGHDVEAFENVGFITSFTRGTEWTATGRVTQELPKDFPSAEKPNSRKFMVKGP